MTDGVSSLKGAYVVSSSGARLDDQGREIPDPKPMEVPAGFKEPESLENMIRRLVKTEEFHRQLTNGEGDTWEDAEDFIIPEEGDFDHGTPYEEVFDPVLQRGITPQEFHERADYYRQKYMDAEAKAYSEMLKSDALRRVPRKEAPSHSPHGGRAGSGGGPDPGDKTP